MRILVCPPRFFDVDYVINPWMEGQEGCIDPDRAQAQWDSLFESVSRFAEIIAIEPEAGCPDMCFTANAGLVESDCVVPTRFRMPERSAEEPSFDRWFRAGRFDVHALSTGLAFEGEGDALFQPGEPLLWAGYGVRTMLESHLDLAQSFGVEVLSLRLVDPRFYHLDTCFAPLPDGRLIYYPAAFDTRSQQLIEDRIPSDSRIAVSDSDAMAFACNLLCVEDRIFLNHASPELEQAVGRWGYAIEAHPVDEFLKAGGAVKCLSLHLEQPDFARPDAPPPSPIASTEVEIRGHLLDAELLRRAVDIVTIACGSFRIETIDLAERKDQSSRVRLHLAAPSAERLDAIVAELSSIGADPIA